MKLVRTILFWSHLTAGVVAGIVILVMSSTGAALALKPQILHRIERDVRFVTPMNTPQLTARELLTAVREARPEASPVSLSRDRNPEAAATVNLGAAGTVYVNPYNAAVLGTGSARANQFFQTLTTWHRYLGASGDARPLARSVTGASNIAFLVLATSGLYIWWPRQLTVRHLRSVTWFRRPATARAREFNWHNVIGFWCLPAIVIMTVSGAVLSYPWASNLVYRLTGSPIPAVRTATPAAASREGGERRAQAAAANRRPDGNAGGEQAATVVPARLDAVWARAEAQVPTWSLISLRLPNRDGAPASFTITDGSSWNPFARSTLTLNSASGDVVTWQPYDGGSLGQKVRGWLRFAHTGELGGLPGQLVAGMGCLGGVMLVYTGLSLAFRRLWNWSLWSRLHVTDRSRPTGARPEAAVARMSREAAVD